MRVVVWWRGGREDLSRPFSERKKKKENPTHEEALSERGEGDLEAISSSR